MEKKKSGRAAVPVSSLRAERITELMQREGLNQNTLAEALNKSQQNISRILTSKKVSEQTVRDIVDRFPEYREEWLLGYDEIPTHKEMHEIENRAVILNAPITVLYDALHEVCAREKMEVPELDNIPELLLIEAQLKDFAISLMWNYVKYRKESCLWSYLDQIEQKRKV